MITLFENFLDENKVKEFASLFYRKLCDYGCVGTNYYDRGSYETEYVDDEKYIFVVIIRDEIGDIILTTKGKTLNNSSFYNIFLEYLNGSEFFEKIEVAPSKYKNLGTPKEAFKIVGTPDEVEEDMKQIEIMVQAKKYNL